MRSQPPQLKGEQELVSGGERERGFQETEGTAYAKAQGQEKAWHVWAAPRGVGWAEHIPQARGHGEVTGSLQRLAEMERLGSHGRL